MKHPAYAAVGNCLRSLRSSSCLVLRRQLPISVCMSCDPVQHGTGGGKAPAMKPTQFMSNSWCVLQELSVRRDKSHRHQPLMGGRAAKAAKYPDDLRKAICRGLVNQQKYDRSHRVCTGGLSAGSLSSLLQSVNEGGENHVEPPDGHVNTP